MKSFNFPVLILAGGLGTRLSEETEKIPKPMVSIGGKPILWHIIKIYLMQGFREFYIATGYKSEIIENWALTLDSGAHEFNDFKVTTIFTGKETPTGGRILRLLKEISSDRFALTYGDGLANIDLHKLVRFHESHQKIATVTSVRPPARFGHISSDNGLVTYFGEKVPTDSGWINGGFFIFEKEIEKYITDDTPFETIPMNAMIKDQNLMTYRHLGFWQPMDTLREKKILDELAELSIPPWFDLSS